MHKHICILCLVFLTRGTISAQDATIAGKFTVEHPT